MAARIIGRGWDLLIVIFSIILANATAFSFSLQFPSLTRWSGLAWIIVKGWLIVTSLILTRMASGGMLPQYLAAWKRQPFLIAFAIVGVLSISWSISIEASLYKLSVFLFASICGAYLALRYGLRSGFELLRGAGMVFGSASLLLLAWYPPLARLDNYPYFGAWRGIFWHRNHLGGLMAFFSSVFLLKLLAANRKMSQVIANLLFLTISILLVWGSRSATGAVVLLVLLGALLIAALWLRLRARLGNRHYFLAAIVAVILSALLLLNKDTVFSLLGRSSTLTGRIPLWADLIGRVWAARPLAGYGFGALWMDESFRISLQTRHLWPYQVFFADNGYLDLLLNTGAVGLAAFLGFLVSTTVRSFQAFLKSTDLLSGFPLLICLFVAVANISYSFLLEVDQFVWMLLVMAAFWADENAGSEHGEIEAGAKTRMELDDRP
jgi:O-antigen ligase